MQGDKDQKLRDWLRSVFTGWQRPTEHPVDDRGEGAEALIGFVVSAALVGVLTGISAATFRLLLEQAARLRTNLAGWAHGSWWGLIVVVLACTAASTVAAALVHRVEPHAEGSGIPRVEAIADGRTGPGRFRVLPVKYIGGLLAIGGGLALGREGPSVQMGGTAAVIVATLTRRNSAALLPGLPPHSTRRSQAAFSSSKSSSSASTPAPRSPPLWHPPPGSRLRTSSWNRKTSST